MSAPPTYAAARLLAKVAVARAEKLRAEATFAPGFAPDFNTLSVMEPGETHLTRILRWLLDEHETHGQGALFRDGFLSALLQEEPRDWIGARATCEVATADGRGRIDLLLLSADGSRSIALENKPWAGWQSDQLARYLRDQSAVRKVTRVHALIGGSSPDAATALAQHWGARPPPSVTASSYHDFVAWLELCAPTIKAERVRSFVTDFAAFCRSSISGGSDMKDSSEVVALIASGDPETLQAARLIADAMYADVPRAITAAVAERLGATTERIGLNPTLKIERHGVILHFMLMTQDPWVGVTDSARVDQLRGAFKWALHEKQWPRWIRVRDVSTDGAKLREMLSSGNTKDIDPLILSVADLVIGEAKQDHSLGEASAQVL